jgi:hypothetical protein
MTRFIPLSMGLHFLSWTAGLLLLSLTCNRVALAISITPVWKSPESLATSVSYDNQRGDRFLAYDHYGVPSVVSITSGGTVNFSRQLDGVNWVTGNFGGSSAKHASLAFDRRELPGVTYGDSSGLHYVYFSSATSSFQNNLVDNTSVSLRQWTLGTGIAFDLYGRPAVAATVNDGSSGDLYAVRDTNQDGVLSSADTLELVTTNPDQFPSLVFDQQNRPVIASRNSPVSIDVAIKDPFLPWATKLLSSNANPGSPDTVIGSIAIDPTDGMPGVTWTNLTIGPDLRYAKWNQLENQWDSTIVVSTSSTQYGNTSLAYDPSDGRPAISYSDSSGNVKFAWFNGSAWTTQTVLSTGTAFAPRTSLAFNQYGHGFPAIAYITNTGSGTGDLKFVVDPTNGVPEPAAVVLFGVGVVLLSASRRQRATCFSSPR